MISLYSSALYKRNSQGCLRKGKGVMFLRHLLVPGIELPDLANENTGNLIKFELQRNKYCMGRTHWRQLIVYLATLVNH